jgi:hypothetical protein
VLVGHHDAVVGAVLGAVAAKSDNYCHNLFF